MSPGNDERGPLDKDPAHCRETAKAADMSMVAQPALTKVVAR